jgi:signal transduction histidine kinase
MPRSPAFPGTARIASSASLQSWLPVVILIAGVTATLILFHSLRVQEQDHIWRTVDGEAEAVARAIQGVFTSHVQSLLRLAKRTEFRPVPDIQWREDARMVLEHSFGLEAIDWIDPSLQIRSSVHTGGEKRIDRSGAFGTASEPGLVKLGQEGTAVVSRAIRLSDGGMGVLIYLPIYSSADIERFQGFIAGALNIQSTMTGLLDTNFLRRYDLEISERGKPVYIKPGTQPDTKYWAQEADLKLYGVLWFGSVWKIRVWPRRPWLDEMRSSLDRVVLLSGVALSALLSLLTHFFQLAHRRAVQLQAANLTLKTEMSERARAQSALADFTAMIVHDLRSPLSNVISILELMRDGMFGAVSAEQLTWMHKAENTTRQSIDLVSDFLDVSKLESGRLELRKEPVAMPDLIRSSISSYSLTAQHKQIQLKEDLPSSLPRLQADPRRLEQVLSNLLSNALKFTPTGGEIIVGAAEKQDEVEIWVKDSGVGIPPDEIGQIFEKYKQTTSGVTSEQKGTGLGLVICKMIVEAHGGTIRAKSDNGTVFTFTIPLGSDADTQPSVA